MNHHPMVSANRAGGDLDSSSRQTDQPRGCTVRASVTRVSPSRFLIRFASDCRELDSGFSLRAPRNDGLGDCHASTGWLRKRANQET